MTSPKRFLIRHVGNMGDMVFFIPPVLETLKKKYAGCHITFVTAWGYKQKPAWNKMSFKELFTTAITRQRPGHWGNRNQAGFSIALMMTNPHIDQLIHWHDTRLDVESTTCCEEGHCFPTWNKDYYEKQKKSGGYDAVWELDFGLTQVCDPINEMYKTIGLPQETYSNYQLYLTEEDKEIAATVMKDKPRPRIILLESLVAENTRGWDKDKIPALVQAIKERWGVDPIWFGGKYIPQHNGRALTLRQNIATMLFADVALGVLSGPLHFAAAVGLPTLTLFADQPLHRAAPAYFLNEYITNPKKYHRTLVGPSPETVTFLKGDKAPDVLSPHEKKLQRYKGWQSPGRQATKSALAPITVDEIMLTLHDMLNKYE